MKLTEIDDTKLLPSTRWLTHFYSGDGKIESSVAAFKLAYNYEPDEVFVYGHHMIYCVHPAGVHPARVGKDRLATRIR